jgi:uncharacterized protein YcgL (UPF0745 family)
MRKLPIGISDFKKLREENFIYVDKTQYIYKLITEGGYYFLSRPRHFGKSLLISTLEYLFKGEKKLFKWLYIEDKWNWEEIYPVLRIDFGDTQVGSRVELEKELKAIIIEAGKVYGYTYNEEYTINRNLRLLIEKIYEVSKKQMIILIDEYDKPILDNIEKKKEVEKIRETLKGFYTTLKGLDKYIRFMLITGVSKFSKVSLFIGLNQLEDISLNKDFGNICGYTQQELEFYFNDYLKGLNLDEIKEWYNGYYFLQDTLYNPFDILLYLKNREFRSYWYKTGTPTFLIKLIKQQKYDVTKLDNIILRENILEKFDLEEIRIEALMFQTGYLTIKEVYQKEYGQEYKLGFPNKEVKISFNENILEFTIKEEVRYKLVDEIITILKKEEIRKLKEKLEILISNISYMYLKEEASYVLAVFVLLYSTGLNVITEDNTSKGRIDLTIVVNNSIVYILEFKVIENTQEKGKALKQILQKEYYKKYLNYEKIYLIGIELDKIKKQIVNFEYQKIK